MGELIFVLVIVVQGIAGVAAAINKKKRAREAALKGTSTGADSKASPKAGGLAKDASGAPGPANAFTARLEKARAARIKKAEADPTVSASSAPASANPASSNPASVPKPPPVIASTSEAGSFDARLARRREQIAQLRALATGQRPGITSSPPTPAPQQPPAPTRSAPAGGRLSGRGGGSQSPLPTKPAPAPATSRTVAKAPAPAPAPAPAEFSQLTRGREGRKARGRRRREGLHKLLATRSDLKRAIILKEILDPPVSLRQDPAQGS